MAILHFALTVPLICINRSHISTQKDFSDNNILLNKSTKEMKLKADCLARPPGPGSIRHQGYIKMSALSSERTQFWACECSCLPQQTATTFPDTILVHANLHLLKRCLGTIPEGAHPCLGSLTKNNVCASPCPGS